MSRLGSFVFFYLISGFLGAQTRVQFDPSNPDIGPFPTDYLTVADPAQKTGLRVNLPLPDCQSQPGTCEEYRELNQLDGFHVYPRIRVKFSGPVQADTLRDGIWYFWMEDLTDEEFGLQASGHLTPINEVVYDPATNTAYAKPDEFMAQHRRYAIVVTDAVRDAGGNPVAADPAFVSCAGQSDGYCGNLGRAVKAATAAVAPRAVVGASVFTTMSATAWLEKARGAIQNSPLTLEAGKQVIRVADIASLTLHRQVGVNPVRFDDLTAPVAASALLQGISRIAFGTFSSPDFLSDQRVIPPAPTKSDIALPASATRIAFHAYLPSSTMPAGGYPVVIFGHELTDSSFGAPTLVAGMMARAGFATIAINAVGHGSGPESTLVVKDNTGKTTEIPTGGRSVDLNGDGTIDLDEGCLVPGPPGLRDCVRQTSLDLMQLVRAIRSGMDLDNDGVVDLDGSHIYYAGQSLGAIYGTIVNAVEPDIRAAALNVGGASVVNIARWSPTYRNQVTAYLSKRVPPLSADGELNDNYVLRYRPAKINDVPGAIEIQNVLDNLEWLQASGDPLAYAPHLKSSTLPGVPIKEVLFQFAKGDESVPNPASTELIRAANMRDKSRFYRHDYARAVAPALQENPHTFLIDLTSPAGIAIALAAQGQIADFLRSDGQYIPDPNPLLRPFFGKDLFELPDFLTEDLNF